MASKFALEFQIPAGFPEILKDFTREALREQPADVNAFGYEYFMKAIAERDAPSNEDGGAGEDDRLSPEELRQRIEELFIGADKDGNGVLDRKEFKQVFVDLREELGLSNKDIRRVMSEADENQDGCIDYSEFVTVAVDVVNSVYAKRDFEAEQEARKDDALEDAREFLLHGMPREDLEAMLKDIFLKADGDGNGWLSRSEFVGCMKEADLGFTRKEINVLLSEVDADADGKVTYDEFVPLCFQLLVEMVSDSLVETPQEEEELSQYLRDLLNSSADEDGMVGHKQAIQLLKDADLGLTRIQIHAVLSELGEDGSRHIGVEELATKGAGVIISLVNVQEQQARAARLGEVREQMQDSYGDYSDRAQLGGALTEAFTALDTEGTGMLSMDQVKQALASSIGEHVSGKYMQALLSLAVEAEEEDGQVRYDIVADMAYDCLQWLQEQELQNAYGAE